MAQPHAAACMQHKPTSSLTSACDLSDAIDDIAIRFSALEALEQLIMSQKADTSENLSHVDRDGLGMLLCILNVDMRQQIDKAQAMANEALEFHRVLRNAGVTDAQSE